MTRRAHGQTRSIETPPREWSRLLAFPPDDPVEEADASEEVNILVVDDRYEDLLAIEGILADASYRVVRASSGEDALRSVLERDFALILLDVVMGGLDGFETATIIKQRARCRHTPIIFLTSAGLDVSFIYRAYSVGAVDYLVKPLDADVLRAKVRIFADIFRKDRRIERQAEALATAERREKELALRELRIASERRYRNLAEAIPQIVWTADREGAINYANQRWLEYSGQTPGQAASGGWLQALHPEDTDDCVAHWRAALASETDLGVECRIRGRDGQHRWHLCRAVPDRDEHGEVLGWLGTCTDFDEAKKAHEAAEAAVHARDEFLSVASHELRTPLTTLLFRLQTLESSLPQLLDERWDDELGRKLASARRQTNRIASLVDSLLDLSRITSGTMKLFREKFALDEMARDVVERFAEAAAAARCQLTLVAEPGIVGSWDRMRVEQVLQNLLANAIKYAAGSSVEIGVADDRSGATLSVTDNGPGIASDDAERIFTAFERAAPARHYGGLGLGLYISRQIADAHGGTLRLSSTPGHGATFVLELPREIPSTPAAR